MIKTWWWLYVDIDLLNISIDNQVYCQFTTVNTNNNDIYIASNYLAMMMINNQSNQQPYQTAIKK